jgi:hypothetical protein
VAGSRACLTSILRTRSLAAPSSCGCPSPWTCHRSPSTRKCRTRSSRAPGQGRRCGNVRVREGQQGRWRPRGGLRGQEVHACGVGQLSPLDVHVCRIMRTLQSAGVSGECAMRSRLRGATTVHARMPPRRACRRCRGRAVYLMYEEIVSLPPPRSSATSTTRTRAAMPVCARHRLHSHHHPHIVPRQLGPPLG